MRTTMFVWLAVSLAVSVSAQNGATQTQEPATPGRAGIAAKGRAKAQAPPAKPLSQEDAEIQRLEEERKRLLKQKEIEKLRKENEQLEPGAEKPATGPQVPPAKPVSPEDAEILRLQAERNRLLKQKEIEKLRKENEQLEPGAEKPATVAQASPPKALSPEDAELQRLAEERKQLLKEQEIEKMRKQNEALKAPPQPPNQVQPSVSPAKPCPPPTPQGPKVSIKTPPIASAWACQHLGVCADSKPAPPNGDRGCAAAPANGQAAQ